MSVLQQTTLFLSAPAKINLGLRVTGRRLDGYHTIETVMQKIGLCDELELRRGGKGIRLRCPNGTAPEDETNLVYRAADLFLRTMADRCAGPLSGVDIVLRKRIPVAAGLGGGSSDAAATLKGMQALTAVRCSEKELAAMGLRLGADVPFFLGEAPAARATGIGEILTPVAPLTNYTVVVVNPGFPVSTQWVYQTFALTVGKNKSKKKCFKKNTNNSDEKNRCCNEFPQSAVLRNDLESVTVVRYPEIGRLKNELRTHGAEMALMSGSGPSVFGLFARREDAESSYNVLRKRIKFTFMVAPLTRSEQGNVLTNANQLMDWGVVKR
ncbi:4-(cytidine 5'-diphospho)-2-C-methyl-D-erythritol kinase [Desulfobulbus alkaliphilus]|nr:4-(cytidine 5'-diphospho)-2-C-methyl-D-erythritol kinase [Desulfobulbus alkaliphilus]MBM9536370.1 4-(cytidine 5'-diphospho)-2-C-methyl-D-erythritol kinase [Desulfobulbus alkaliphilus]